MTGPAAFSRRGALLLVGGGFALLLALLWLVGAGSNFIGGEEGGSQAHAAAPGLNGYAGLVTLVEAQGYATVRARGREGLTTSGLLVITPGFVEDPETIGKILTDRQYVGPTLVILPKWLARAPSPALPAEARAKFKRGWVTLDLAEPSGWPEELPEPYRFTHKPHPQPESPGLAQEAAGAPPPPAAKPAPARWRGFGLTGTLPTPQTLYADPAAPHDVLIADAANRPLAFIVTPRVDGEIDEDAYPVAFLVDPDVANNYGLADPARAAVAIALVDELTYGGEIEDVTFDMTLNGLGASENLLTLAFRPPFLAATLSLLVALLIVGWRAFQRFGPAAAAGGPDIAFGKRQLIANGANLIVRARRFGLLGAPYAALAARRLADRLGLARPDGAAIDAALARRLPDAEPFTRRAARLEAAAKPADILAAAQKLDELNARLQQGPNTP